MTLLAVLLVMGQMELSLGRAEKSPQGEREERDPYQPYMATQHLCPGKMASPRLSKE